MMAPEGTDAPLPWPTDISLNRADQILTVVFDNGSIFCLPAELLRVESPSAEVQGHGRSQKQLVAGKRQVAITGIEPVGNYAVRLKFDDGHDTGLYSWRVLYKMGSEQEQLWSTYLKTLSEQGLSRDR